jgi:hypothetical protein
LATVSDAGPCERQRIRGMSRVKADRVTAHGGAKQMNIGTRGVAAGLATALLLAANPAAAMNNGDVAGALGMLWRVREGVCPKISLDPDRFGALIQPGGMKAAEIRKRYAEAFDQGYAVAGEWLSEGGPEEYCKAVHELFDGKSDFFGNARTIPDAPTPGLTFRE